MSLSDSRGHLAVLVSHPPLHLPISETAALYMLSNLLVVENRRINLILVFCYNWNSTKYQLIKIVKGRPASIRITQLWGSASIAYGNDDGNITCLYFYKGFLKSV